MAVIPLPMIYSMERTKIAGIQRIRTSTDGEGVTTLVVFMNCPLRCAYCLNPFTWDGSFKGSDITTEELYDELKIDNLYFLATGGGVMFGGGEPLLNHTFIKDFINTYRNTGWKFNMETSLSAKQEFIDELTDYIDCFVVDSKDMNKERYELYTKGDYDLFYNNLMHLKDKVGSERIIVRVPKIFDFHKNDEYKENVALLKELGFENIEVFDYVDPGNHKSVSKKSVENKNEFLEKIKSK